MTQEIARIFEQGIRDHPADWHMLQRVFVCDLDPQRLAASRARLAARERVARRNGTRPGQPAAGQPAASGPASDLAGDPSADRPPPADTTADRP